MTKLRRECIRNQVALGPDPRVTRRIAAPIAPITRVLAPARPTLLNGTSPRPVDTRLPSRALVYQGRQAEAAPLYDRALAATRDVYGEHHIRFASVLSLMGDTARERRQLDEAQARFEQAAAIYPRFRSPSGAWWN